MAASVSFGTSFHSGLSRRWNFSLKQGRCFFKYFMKHRSRSRSLSSSTGDVRVRFAPSPTGFLHLGGLRTALYNFLFARSQNGSFILRIEDTDQSRAVPGALEMLQETLQWAGIEPDEGPTHGGKYGPYIQSERIDIYQQNIKTLLDKGWAYPCFCTARRLELMRKEASRLGEPSKYDGRCRSLTSQQVEESLAAGIPYVVRLKLEPTPDPWEDLLKGPSVHDIIDIEGDPILMKSDGFPTYHFANVVDDHLMEVTHVLRGSEWLSSTPKHILLYKAFGWDSPKFGHLPLIVNPDGSKLSKRQGDIHIKYFQDAGYFPQAVLNYITSIGGGFGGSTQGMALSQMCSSFKIENIRRNPGRLDPVWLCSANRQILRDRVDADNPLVIAELIQEVKNLVLDKYDSRLEPGPLRDQILGSSYILNVIKWSLVDDRVTVLKDFLKQELEYLWVTPSQSTLKELAALDEEAEPQLCDFLQWLSQLNNFETDVLTQELRAYLKRHNKAPKHFFTLIRTALTGLKQGAPLAEMLSVMGKANTTARLEQALRTLKES